MPSTGSNISFKDERTACVHFGFDLTHPEVKEEWVELRGYFSRWTLHVIEHTVLRNGRAAVPHPTRKVAWFEFRFRDAAAARELEPELRDRVGSHGGDDAPVDSLRICFDEWLGPGLPEGLSEVRCCIQGPSTDLIRAGLEFDEEPKLESTWRAVYSKSDDVFHVDVAGRVMEMPPANFATFVEQLRTQLVQANGRDQLVQFADIEVTLAAASLARFVEYLELVVESADANGVFDS